MKKVVFLLLLLAFHTAVFAQGDKRAQMNPETRLMELKAKINVKALSAKDLDRISEIRKIYDYGNLDSALFYAQLEVKLAKKTENPNLVANAQLAQATLHWKLQQADLAYELLLDNIANREQIADSILARSLFRIAKVEIQKKMPSESIDHVIEASTIFQSLEDSVSASACFSHIAGIYTFVLTEPEKGIPYFDKALAFNNSKDHQNSIRIYINYSSAYVGIGKFDEALKKLRNAEKIAIKTNNSMFLPSVYAQFAFIYNDSGDFEKSLEYARKGEELTKTMPNFDPGVKDKIHWYIALGSKELDQNTEALKYFKLLENSPYLDPWTLQENFVEIYSRLGNFEQAFLIQNKLIAAKDSIDELERFSRVKEVTEKYENEKKQQEIITLNAEKELQESEIRTQRVLLYGTIAFFVILILIGTFWYRTRAKLRETTLSLKSAELQQRFLRTQLNPHFFFHALTSIEAYIYKNDKLESARFLRNFSVLMRNILEFSDVDLITLKEDIEFIKKYMELQQLNHEFQFNYEVRVSSDIHPEDLRIPPMLIQPAVENAILHGALKTENGLVSIEYAKVSDQLEILIKDNGGGRKDGKSSSNRLHRSMSLDITQTRIKNFKEVHGIAIEYHPFDESSDDAHSSVVFRIPLNT